VIAVACKEVESRPDRQYGVADEDDMIHPPTSPGWR
jgi:hypothetical protein